VRWTAIGIDMNIFFTSDTHFGHTNIIKHCARPFETVSQMDNELIRRWNTRVGRKDVVYHLGDFSFGNVEKYRRCLNGSICLIRGNHDNKPSYDKAGFAWIKDNYLLKTPRGQFWLAHYAHLTWPHRCRGSYHLFGHSHSKLSGAPLSMDVGVDTNNYAPYSLDEVLMCLNRKNSS